MDGTGRGGAAGGGRGAGHQWAGRGGVLAGGHQAADNRPGGHERDARHAATQRRRVLGNAAAPHPLFQGQLERGGSRSACGPVRRPPGPGPPQASRGKAGSSEDFRETGPLLVRRVFSTVAAGVFQPSSARSFPYTIICGLSRLKFVKLRGF